MKRFILFLCVLCLGLPVFAEYKPIPKELSEEYRTEITKLINTRYSSTVKEIKEIASDAHKMYLKVLKDKNFYSEYCDKDFEMLIDTPEFYLYLTIIDITDKYVSIKDDEALATDWSAVLYDFLLPYFKANNINTSKLDRIYTLTAQKQQIILREQENLHRFVYPNDY